MFEVEEQVHFDSKVTNPGYGSVIEGGCSTLEDVPQGDLNALNFLFGKVKIRGFSKFRIYFCREDKWYMIH